MTLTVSSGTKYTFSIENIFIITEILPSVSQFGDQDKVFCMNRYLSHLMRETFRILMQYEIEMMYTLGIIAFKFICTIFSFIKWL